MIFQLSDWFPKPMIWAIIIKFDQIRKNWLGISCAEILEVGKKFFAVSSVKKMSWFEGVSPEKIKRIAWKFTETVILLGLAGYEPTASLVIYISSYPARPRRITVKYVRAFPTVMVSFENACFVAYETFKVGPFLKIRDLTQQDRRMTRKCHARPRATFIPHSSSHPVAYKVSFISCVYYHYLSSIYEASFTLDSYDAWNFSVLIWTIRKTLLSLSKE